MLFPDESCANTVAVIEDVLDRTSAGTPMLKLPSEPTAPVKVLEPTASVTTSPASKVPVTVPATTILLLAVCSATVISLLPPTSPITMEAVPWKTWFWSAPVLVSELVPVPAPPVPASLGAPELLAESVV